MSMALWRAAPFASMLLACGSMGNRAAPVGPVASAEPPAERPAAYAASEPAARPQPGAPAQAPGAKLTLEQARRFMVDLINRDRASAGLGPVELDAGPPSRAGQAHAEDMARNGYLGHWGTDG